MSTLLVNSESPCPCQPKKVAAPSYGECCQPYLQGIAHAETAEKLMRSRYTAYALGDLEYIKQTWHPRTLPAGLRLVPGQVWLGLKIRRVEAGAEKDMKGLVEFIAKSKRNGRARRMHEVSEFEKLNGRWFYVKGDYSTK